MNCRILPHQVLDGPANMAFDEAMLEAVDADPSSALLRTYEWARPTLSLGYFQRIAEAESDPRWSGVDLVRRPTGGGAIWHHHDVTYALVLPASHPAYAAPEVLYAQVHEAIAAGLRDWGLNARRRGEVGPEIRKIRPFLCFTDRHSEDIVIDGAKIVGSSQRRRPGAVLQHGSVLLGSSATTPELAGLEDFAGRAVHASAVASILRTSIPPALHLTPVEFAEVAPWPERLREYQDLHRSRQWTARR